jgi:hypothetical protein
LEAALEVRGLQHQNVHLTRQGFAKAGQEVWCQNNSGVDYPLFSVVALDSNLWPIDLEADNTLHPVGFKVSTPTAATKATGWGVITSPCIKFDPLDPTLKGVGRVLINGMTQVKVNIISETDSLARPIDGEFTRAMSSSSNGYPIVYKPGGTGDKWCIVHLAGTGAGTAGAAKARFIQFTNNQAFTRATASVGATVIEHWDGLDPGNTVTVWNTCSKWFAVQSGTCGVARLDENQDRYQIIMLWEERARFIQFTATDPIVLGNEGPYAITVNEFWDGVNPGPAAQVQNTAGLFEAVGSLAVGIARWNYEEGVYQIVHLDGRTSHTRFAIHGTGRSLSVP